MYKHFLQALNQQQILSTIPSGLFLVDKKRHIVYWNREAERILGYSAHEAIGRHCAFLEGIECGQGCGLYDEGTPSKPIIGAECRIRTKDGRLRVISKNVDFLVKDGEIIGGIESFIDITQQKMTEESLRLNAATLERQVNERSADLKEERDRLNSVLEGMSDPAYIVTNTYKLNFLNKAMALATNAQKGQTCYEIFQNRTEPCRDCPWQSMRAEQTVQEERTFGRNKRTYEIIHTPLKSFQGDIQKLAVCRDVTERVEDQQKLLNLNQRLNSFVHTVSHDLRSPLTGIICYSEFIIKKYGSALDEEGVTMLSEINSQGHRVINILEDMLCLSTSGQIDLPEEPEDSNEIFNQVLADNLTALDEKSIELSIDDLPQLHVPKGLLYELFSNLLLNAVRYGCNLGSKIEVYGKTEKDYQSISIVDYGPGIPETERESVFEIFVRGSSSDNVQGSGIGLATVQKIMNSLCGEVVLQETPGGGCTFKLLFPV